MKTKILFLLLLLFVSQSIYGINWDGGAGTTSWHDADNWVGNVLPVASDYVLINSGAITVDITMPVDIQGVRIINGTLNINSTLNCIGAGLPGIWDQGTVVNSGIININSNHNGIHMANSSFTNNGQVHVTGAGQSGIYMQLNATFTNNDILNIDGTTHHGILIDASSCSLINNSINGEVTIGGVSAISFRGILNKGNISGTGNFTIDDCGSSGIENNAGASFVVDGVLMIGATSPCTAYGILNHGTFENGNEVVIHDVGLDRLRNDGTATFTNNSILNFIGTGNSYTAAATGMLTNASTGSILGEGSIDGSAAHFTNLALISPGASPGKITFNAGFTNTTYQAELLSTATADIDNLIFVGAAADFVLSDTLNVILLNSYTPTANDEFEVITAGSGYTGTFDSINWPTPSVEWEIQYNSADVTIKYLGAVAPVDLHGFSAVAKKDYIKLSWETASEINNAGFYLQKSKNGLDWEDMSWIEGSLNSITNKAYYFDDRFPFESSNYYRLKQLDLDGKVVLSKMIQVNWTSNEVEFHTFPSPAVSVINLELPQKVATHKSIDVINSQGQLVLHLSTTSNTIDVSSLSNGIYFIRVYMDQKVYNSPLIVTKDR